MFLFTVGAVVKRRDVAEEAKRSCAAGAAEFPGIVETDSNSEFEHLNRCVVGNSPSDSRQLRRDGGLAEDKA